MWHYAPLSRSLPRSVDNAQPVASHSAGSYFPDQSLAETGAVGVRPRWPGEATSAEGSAQHNTYSCCARQPPVDWVHLNVRGAPLFVRRKDLHPAFTKPELACLQSYFDDQGKACIFVNLEVSTVHRVLDFYRDKKVPLFLGVSEARALKRAAQLLDDRDLLVHLRSIWPLRKQAHDAKGTPSYPDKLFALAGVCEQNGLFDVAEKKRNKGLQAYLQTIREQSSAPALQLPSDKWPTDVLLAPHTTSNTPLVTPFLHLGRQLSLNNSQDLHGGWVAASAEAASLPSALSPSNALLQAMDFPVFVHDFFSRERERA